MIPKYQLAILATWLSAENVKHIAKIGSSPIQFFIQLLRDTFPNTKTYLTERQ